MGGADIGVGITGIAGPTGGTDEKPVGTVHFSLVSDTATVATCLRFSGDRCRVQCRSADTALGIALGGRLRRLGCSSRLTLAVRFLGAWAGCRTVCGVPGPM